MSLGIGIGISAVLLATTAQPGGGQPIPAYTADFTTGSLPSGMTFSRSSAATYWDSAGVRQTAPANTPRFDFDPISKALRGLLIEEAKTNFLLNSTAPATQTVSLAVGTFTLWMEGTGSVTAAAGTAAGSGFGTATAGDLGTYGTVDTFTITTAGTVTFTVSGSVSTFQCENGAYPTSLIITGGSSAQRTAEQITQPGITSFFNVGGPGSMLAEFIPAAQMTITATAATFSNGTNNNLFYALNRNSTRASNGGMRDNALAATANINGPNLNDFANAKLAYAWASGDQVLVTNGSVGGTSTRSDISTNFTQVSELRFGRNGANGAYLNGWMRKLSYYNSRLANTDLQTLTGSASIF